MHKTEVSQRKLYRLISNMHEYVRRREVLKKIHGGKGEAYVQATKRITQTLKNLRKKISMLRWYERYYKAVHDAICEYLIIKNFRNTIGSTDPQLKLAKEMMCKYVLENSGTHGSYLSEWLGTFTKEYAGRTRLKFTRKLVDPEVKNTWKNFKEYMADQQIVLQNYKFANNARNNSNVRTIGHSTKRKCA